MGSVAPGAHFQTPTLFPATAAVVPALYGVKETVLLRASEGSSVDALDVAVITPAAETPMLATYLVAAPVPIVQPHAALSAAGSAVPD